MQIHKIKYYNKHNVTMPQLMTENVTTLSPGRLFSCSQGEKIMDMTTG